ncbi:MAG: AAA family ATPase [Bacteroidetes bacterium]|nr:MAG: AAA family ATPase [Bacteroidota bacterium]
MKAKEEATFTENCRYLGLKHLEAEHAAIIQKANKSNIGFTQFIREIIQNETNCKIERSIKYRIRESRLPLPYKLLQDFDFDFQPGLKKKLIMDLATLGFVRQNESILFIGETGTGKSHLSRSLAFIACQKRYKVLYTTCSDMLNDLNQGVYEKTLLPRLQKYVVPELLVIDEMGHDRLELEVAKEAHLLFKVIDQRYNQDKPLIFTTNVEEPDWADFLGDPVSTKAIIDRIFHHSVIIRIDGPSYRKYESEKLQQKYSM